MQKHEKLMDIDHLRSYDVEPAYFGLGFIQLKIKSNSRVHFYHDDLPVLAEEPHDHRYNFISYILQGKFEQTIYQFDADKELGKYLLEYENCQPYDRHTPVPNKLRGNLREVMSCRFQAGDYYNIDSSTLHKVRGRDNAITYLVRQDPIKDLAAVVRHEDDDRVCPFSEPIPVKQCWELIEDMLPKTDAEAPKKKKSKFGYHVANIPKGKIGEPSKIVEEAMEIADAHAQGVKLMAAVEMSDLYGALDRYREKHHPDLTMDDICAMYKVTRRAFDNGKRK